MRYWCIEDMGIPTEERSGGRPARRTSTGVTLGSDMVLPPASVDGMPSCL